MKVCISPWYTREDRADGGIRRVTDALIRWLPDFGWEAVKEPGEADVINCHGASLIDAPGKPLISTSHGLMWQRYEWPGWAHEINKNVVEVMVRAQTHTAPSHWVANALRRGMLIYPTVIHHGIDIEEWPLAKEAGPYILWNKARADAVSDPVHMNRVAALLPKRAFLATIGTAAANVKVLGAVDYPTMHDIVRNAGVYLATTRETFGIATLEALASGVPVAGFAWGGQNEIIIEGETGYLAQPGDYAGLADCIEKCFEDRPRMSAACREDAIQRWQWPDKVQKYAAVYRGALARWSAPTKRISVIIPCYNLGRFVLDAIDSALAYRGEDLEILVVDDCSTEDLARFFDQRKDPRIQYLHTPSNLKLPGVRNWGFQHAAGRYILFLDADDVLAEGALSTLADELDRRPDIHIAYGHLEVADEELKERRRGEWPWPKFSWRAQMAHLNQPHTGAMMRREVMERSGGYRERMWRAEDAEFWCRVTSFGFRAAKVTEATTLIYRNRGDSKSKGEAGDGDWTAWFPWRLAGDARSGLRFINSTPADFHPRPDLVPWSAQGEHPNAKDGKFWPVNDFETPYVSVIIPVGPGHEKYVRDAVETVQAQDFINWEVIVVNDTGDHWAPGFSSPLAGVPWPKILETQGRQGPGIARNMGAKVAKGRALLFLDADDLLLPGILRKMYEIFEDTGGIVYGDWLRADGEKDQPMTQYATWDFKCGEVLKRMRHSVTCLVPTWAHRRVGGFDTKMAGWEDWDYFIALQAEGVCSYRLPEPTFVYRFRAGKRREESFGQKKELVEYLYNKWLEFYQGRREMPCSGCPGSAPRRQPTPQGVQVNLANQNAPRPGRGTRAPDRMVMSGSLAEQGKVEMVVFNAESPSPITFRGPVTGTLYRFTPGEARMVLEADLYTQDQRGFLQRRVRTGPQFTLIPRVARMAPAPVESPQPQSEPLRPDFPEMPMPDVPKPEGKPVAVTEPPVPPMPAPAKEYSAYQSMSYKAIMETVGRDMDSRILLEWYMAEKAGKGRNSILKRIRYFLAKKGVEVAD